MGGGDLRIPEQSRPPLLCISLCSECHRVKRGVTRTGTRNHLPVTDSVLQLDSYLKNLKDSDSESASPNTSMTAFEDNESPFSFKDEGIDSDCLLPSQCTNQNNMMVHFTTPDGDEMVEVDNRDLHYQSGLQSFAT
jgi:hypothetical protein